MVEIIWLKRIFMMPRTNNILQIKIKFIAFKDRFEKLSTQ